MTNFSSHSTSALPRRHEIDAMRSIALLLLIFYHVLCAFQPFASSLAFIQYPDTLEQAWFLGEFLNPWRIPVLFLSAGITAGYLLQNRSVWNLLQARLMRLVPPLVFAIVFIAPLSVLLYQLAKGEALTYYPLPGHLWFVWNLAVYFIFGVPLFLYLKSRHNNLLLRFVDQMSPWSWLILLPGILTLTTYWLEPYINDDNFGTHFIRFWYGLGCFLSGAVFVSMGDAFWQGVRKICHIALLIALGIYFARMVGIDFGGRLPALIARTMESTSAMLAFIGYCSLLFSRPSRLFAVFNRSVFPVYILHLPIQQAVALFLFQVNLNPWLALTLHLVLTLSLSVLVYIVVLIPLRWLHPFFGIASAQPVPLDDAGGQRSRAEYRRPRLALAGRFVTLYFFSPILVIITLYLLIFIGE